MGIKEKEEFPEPKLIFLKQILKKKKRKASWPVACNHSNRIVITCPTPTQITEMMHRHHTVKLR